MALHVQKAPCWKCHQRHQATGEMLETILAPVLPHAFSVEMPFAGSLSARRHAAACHQWVINSR